MAVDTSGDIKRRLRRAKDKERHNGKWLLAHDGPDPRFRPGMGLVTTTGRIGHITSLQADCMSKTYLSEVKNIKVWAGLWAFWKQIVVKAAQHGKEPMMAIYPSNEDTVMEGVKVPGFHIITEDRHAELLRFERDYHEVSDSMPRFERGQAIMGVDLSSGTDETVVVIHQGAVPEVRPVVRSYSKVQQAGRRK